MALPAEKADAAGLPNEPVSGRGHLETEPAPARMEATYMPIDDTESTPPFRPTKEDEEEKEDEEWDEEEDWDDEDDAEEDEEDEQDEEDDDEEELP